VTQIIKGQCPFKHNIGGALATPAPLVEPPLQAFSMDGNVVTYYKLMKYPIFKKAHFPISDSHF